MRYTIAILGVGLIGGSLALCFRGKPGLHVVGYSHRQSSIEKYLKRQIVDEATSDLAKAVADADFIFLCVPVGLLEFYLEQLSKLQLKPGCIITDVGSTKASIMNYATRIPLEDQGVYFVGGHPMAGSERSGVEAASSHLFENAIYVLTPSPDTPETVYHKLEQLLALTRAQIIKMGAIEHDQIAGAISHLPHIIAVVLVNQISGYNQENEFYSRLAAGGFRDITRIASSDPIVWRDILINNRQILLELLKDWDERIHQFIAYLEQADADAIENEFLNASTFRNSLPERRKGLITSHFDVYVDVPDQPGVIGHITTLLGSAKINLSNIQIMESRFDVPGVMRLSFRNQKDQDRAVELLKQNDYHVYL